MTKVLTAYSPEIKALTETLGLSECYAYSINVTAGQAVVIHVHKYVDAGAAAELVAVFKSYTLVEDSNENRSTPC